MADTTPHGPQPPERDSLENLLHQPTTGSETLDVVEAPDSERKRKDKPKRKPSRPANIPLRLLLIAGALVIGLGCAGLFYMLMLVPARTETRMVTVPVVITATIVPFPTDTRAASPAPMFMTTPTASYEFEEPVMLNAVIQGFPIGTRVTIGSTWFDGTTRWYGVITDTGQALEVSEAQLVPVPQMVTPQAPAG